MSKKLIIILLSIGFVIVAIVGYSIYKASSDAKAGKQVEVLEIAKMDVVETVSATGKIKPEIEVSIS
ncbi:MAG: efflux RND transporter periplasmic adaptor subunit, partial [Nonlabens sp.]|nr:efflux RND transporter periplasmic adaptor subunit [Nonlabens sp.]